MRRGDCRSQTKESVSIEWKRQNEWWRRQWNAVDREFSKNGLKETSGK